MLLRRGEETCGRGREDTVDETLFFKHFTKQRKVRGHCMMMKTEYRVSNLLAWWNTWMKRYRRKRRRRWWWWEWSTSGIAKRSRCRSKSCLFQSIHSVRKCGESISCQRHYKESQKSLPLCNACRRRRVGLTVRLRGSNSRRSHSFSTISPRSKIGRLYIVISSLYILSKTPCMVKC